MRMPCHSCRDRSLREKDLFCASCGAPAVGGDFASGPVSGEGLHTVLLRHWDTARPLPALDLVVRCNTEETDRVAVEAFGDADGIVLPGLTYVAQSSAPMHVTFSVEHPLVGKTSAIALQQVSNQVSADLHVVGSMSLAAFVADGDALSGFVAVRNLGGAIAIDTVAVQLPLIEYASAAAPVSPPQVVLPGQTANLRIRISRDAYQSLSSNIGLARGARLRAGSAEIGLLIVDEAESSLKLHVRDTHSEGRPFAGAGIAGRRARIGVALENRSPEAVTITDIRISRRGGPSDVDLRIPLRWQGGIEPGQIISAELRPHLTADLMADGKKLEPGHLFFTVTVFAKSATDTAPLDTASDLSFEVRDAAPFKGRVCIDFGTTETAAAISKAVLQDLRPPKFPPQVVELGCVGLTPKQSSKLAPVKDDIADPVHPVRFLETSLALDADGRWTVGEDIPGTSDEGADAAFLFRRFKWLADDEPPEHILETAEAIRNAMEADEPHARIQRRTDPKLLLEKYLSEVVKLIEEHPDVAALCGSAGSEREPSGAQIWATRPVTMNPRMYDTLVAGFRAAGMPQLRTGGDTFVESLILESWPPLLLTTEGDDKTFGQLDLAGEGFFHEPMSEEDEKAVLVVLDVGGGSADFSVIGIRSEPPKTRLEILFNDMSRTFAGTRFEALIESVLRQHLKWSEDSLATARPEIRREFNETVRWLQNSAGPMRPLNGDGSLCPTETTGLPVIRARIDAAFEHPSRGPDVLALYRRRPGTGLVPLTFEELPDLFAKLVSEFHGMFWAHMVQHVTALAAIAKAREDRLWITVSGRGYACPLASEMIQVLLYEHFGSIEPQFLPPPASKSITSWGALRLVDHLESHHGLTLVLPDESASFSVLKGYSERAKKASRLLLEPMVSRHVAVYLRGKKKHVVVTADGAAPGGEESGKLVTSFRVVLLRADIAELAGLKKASLYSGRNDGDWEPEPEGEIEFLKHPRDAQWLYAVRRNGILEKGAVKATDIDTAVHALLKAIK